MVALHRVVTGLSLALSICTLVPGISFAQSSYYNTSCSSCHGAAPASPMTCNGCHGHGTHASGNRGSMNLVASTDKSSYVAGETIKVTLSGGMEPQSTGWVGIRIYDANGAEVSKRNRDYRCTRSPASAATACDLPMEISITAQAGWTELYVAWAGNVSDSSGSPSPAQGAPVTGAISAGSRALKDQLGNQIADHIEEIIKTSNQFSVTSPAPNTTSSSGGGGSLDWLLISGLIGVFCARRISKRG